MENGDNQQPKSSDSKETDMTTYRRFSQFLRSNNRAEVVLSEVEEFLKAYKTGEEKIDIMKAKELTATSTDVEKGWLGRPKKVIRRQIFSDALGSAIAAYQASKELNYNLMWEQAYSLLDLVQRGRVFGAIRNAKQQRQNYEQEVIRLKEQIENLEKLNDKLIAENKLLHGIADAKTGQKNNGKGDTEIGDVGV